MTDFDAVAKLASLPTDTVPLCLAGELVGEVAQLERAYAEAGPATNLGESPRRALAEQIAELQERMRESVVDFHLRAMGARAWSRFWASLPVRVEGESDEDIAERTFPFYVKLLAKCCTDPVMSEAQVEELSDLLHGSAWTRLCSAAIAVNGGAVNIPNSEAVSASIGSSEPT